MIHTGTLYDIKLEFSPHIERGTFYHLKQENKVIGSEGDEYLLIFMFLPTFEEAFPHIVAASQKHLERILNKY